MSLNIDKNYNIHTLTIAHKYTKYSVQSSKWADILPYNDMTFDTITVFNMTMTKIKCKKIQQEQQQKRNCSTKIKKEKKRKKRKSK